METRLIEVDNRLKVIENGQAEMKADVKTVQKDTTDLKIELTEKQSAQCRPQRHRTQ